jgi:hypothetical protein
MEMLRRNGQMKWGRRVRRCDEEVGENNNRVHEKLSLQERGSCRVKKKKKEFLFL